MKSSNRCQTQSQQEPKNLSVDKMSLLLRGIIGPRPVLENLRGPPKLSLLSRVLLSSSSPVALSAQQHGHSSGPEDAAHDHVSDMLMSMLRVRVKLKVWGKVNE